MSSDVCKHCTSAACLEVCPTGALFRTEFGTVVVQQDICNGCGYCIPACPYGVIDRREEDGRAHKCTLCYDRLKDDMTPACAKACPTESIHFGPLDEMRERAFERLEVLHVAGESSARLYGEDPADGVGGSGLDLPAPRRARGLRAAARSRLDHARPGVDVARRGGARARAAGRDRDGELRGAAVSRLAPTRRPRADSYYGRPILKAPVWTWEIPAYFFFGGMAGAAAPFALLSELRGDEALARRAWLVALAGAAASPPLLIADLGRPERFHRMLRVIKPTSPMSLGSWVLGASSTAIAFANVRTHLRLVPAPGAPGGRHRRPRPGALDLHRRAHGRHGHPRVARGARRAAVRLRRRRAR